MDNLESPTTSQPDLSQLTAQYRSLHGLLASTVLLIIILSMAFNLYLLREVRTAHSDLKIFRPQAHALINDYQSNSGRAMDELIKKLTEYGQTHPDFGSLLVSKYRISLPSAAPTVSPPITLPTSSTTKAKK